MIGSEIGQALSSKYDKYSPGFEFKNGFLYDKPAEIIVILIVRCFNELVCANFKFTDKNQM